MLAASHVPQQQTGHGRGMPPRPGARYLKSALHFLTYAWQMKSSIVSAGQAFNMLKRTALKNAFPWTVQAGDERTIFMTNDFNRKSSVADIEKRFDNDVDRFSNLDTGQSATVDAPLAMSLITRAAVAVNPNIRYVLDIGCGAGNNTLKLLQTIQSAECDLVDLSMPMLQRAKERVDAVNPGSTRIFQGDIRELSLPEGRYDTVLAAAVLHHLREDQDWLNVFSKIYRLIARGGSFWITDLVIHENEAVHGMMWQQYADHLTAVGREMYGDAHAETYRDKVFEYIEIEDTPRPVTYQLEMLKRVGFEQVDILHKNSCFAAFGGIKTRD